MCPSLSHLHFPEPYLGIAVSTVTSIIILQSIIEACPFRILITSLLLFRFIAVPFICQQERQLCDHWLCQYFCHISLPCHWNTGCNL